MRTRRHLPILLLFAAFVLAFSANAHATTGTGNLEITSKLNFFYQDWIGPIATMFAIAGLVFAFIQIGLSRGPDAFTNAVRWLVVVGLVVGLAAIVSLLGISAATV